MTLRCQNLQLRMVQCIFQVRWPRVGGNCRLSRWIWTPCVRALPNEQGVQVPDHGLSRLVSKSQDHNGLQLLAKIKVAFALVQAKKTKCVSWTKV